MDFPVFRAHRGENDLAGCDLRPLSFLGRPGATQVRAFPAILSTWTMAGCSSAIKPVRATSSSERVQVFLKMASP